MDICSRNEVSLFGSNIGDTLRFLMKGRKNSMNHTFAICAYKESAYLEKCIKSLKNQTIKSNIILVTSTPNDFLEEISKKYNLPYFIKAKKELLKIGIMLIRWRILSWLQLHIRMMFICRNMRNILVRQ